MVDASAAAAAAPPEAPAEQGDVVQGEAVTEAEEAVKVEEGKPAVKGVDRFAWRTEPCVMGIDEAGRGPVLGAMVYGGAVCPLDGGEEALRRVGFMDSKVLKEAVRERLYERMCGDAADLKCYAFVDEISPERLSAQMLSRARVSLNKISHESAMGLVQRALDEGYNVTELIVDTVGDAGRYTDILKARFPGIKCKAEAKADAKFPVVSAASVAAKVRRDRGMRGWAFVEHGGEVAEEEGGFSRVFGSGYPSDPKTVKWLEGSVDRVFGFPSAVRFSWRNARDLLKREAAEVKFEEEDEEDEDDEDGGSQGPAKRQATMASFMAAPGAAARPESESIATKRHAFFKSRKLQRVSAF